MIFDSNPLGRLTDDDCPYELVEVENPSRRDVRDALCMAITYDAQYSQKLLEQLPAAPCLDHVKVLLGARDQRAISHDY